MTLRSVDGSIVVVRSGSVTVAMVMVDKRCVCVYVCIQSGAYEHCEAARWSALLLESRFVELATTTCLIWHHTLQVLSGMRLWVYAVM